MFWIRGVSTFCYLHTPWQTTPTKIDPLPVTPKPLLFTFCGLILIWFKIPRTPCKLLAYPQRYALLHVENCNFIFFILVFLDLLIFAYPLIKKLWVKFYILHTPSCCLLSLSGVCTPVLMWQLPKLQLSKLQLSKLQLSKFSPKQIFDNRDTVLLVDEWKNGLRSWLSFR